MATGSRGEEVAAPAPAVDALTLELVEGSAWFQSLPPDGRASFIEALAADPEVGAAVRDLHVSLFNLVQLLQARARDTDDERVVQMLDICVTAEADVELMRRTVDRDYWGVDYG